MVGLGPCEGFHVVLSVWLGQCFRNFPKSEARTQLERLQAVFMGVGFFIAEASLGASEGEELVRMRGACRGQLKSLKASLAGAVIRCARRCCVYY